MTTDTRIEAFRKTLERLTLIPGRLQTLVIILARAFPFARRHMEEPAMLRTMPTTASTAGRLAFIRSAWMAIDVAMGALSEIRYWAHHGITLIPRIKDLFA